MSKHFLLLCCFVFACNGYVNHAKAMTKVASKGETLVESTAGKLNVLIKIRTHEIHIGKPSDGRPSEIDSSCTYSRYPCSIVDDIDILVDSNRIFVPRSVFCDLADVDNVEISAVEKGVALILYGGDASERYKVKVVFNVDRVMRRILYSAMFPDKPLQETVYHMQVLGE